MKESQLNNNIERLTCVDCPGRRARKPEVKEELIRILDVIDQSGQAAWVVENRIEDNCHLFENLGRSRPNTVARCLTRIIESSCPSYISGEVDNLEGIFSADLLAQRRLDAEQGSIQPNYE